MADVGPKDQLVKENGYDNNGFHRKKEDEDASAEDRLRVIISHNGRLTDGDGSPLANESSTNSVNGSAVVVVGEQEPLDNRLPHYEEEDKKIMNDSVSIPDDALFSFSTGGRVRVSPHPPRESIPLQSIKKGAWPELYCSSAAELGSEKLNGGGASKSSEEVPVNSHRKCLSREGSSTSLSESKSTGEKLYLSEESRKLCPGWRRLILCAFILIIVAVAVCVAVLAATGILLAESENKKIGHSLPSVDSIAQAGFPYRRTSSSHVPRQPLSTTILPTVTWTPVTSKVPAAAVFSEAAQTIVPNALVGEFVIIDENFTDDLNDKSSPGYVTLAHNLEIELRRIFRENRAEFQKLHILSFKSGSIRVKFVVMWIPQRAVIAASTASHILARDLERKNNSFFNFFHVDMESIQFIDVFDECRVQKGGCSFDCSWDYETLQKTCLCPHNTHLSHDGKSCAFNQHTTSTQMIPSIVQPVSSTTKEEPTTVADLLVPSTLSSEVNTQEDAATSLMETTEVETETEPPLTYHIIETPTEMYTVPSSEGVSEPPPAHTSSKEEELHTNETSFVGTTESVTDTISTTLAANTRGVDDLSSTPFPLNTNRDHYSSETTFSDNNTRTEVESDFMATQTSVVPSLTTPHFNRTPAVRSFDNFTDYEMHPSRTPETSTESESFETENTSFPSTLSPGPHTTVRPNYDRLTTLPESGTSANPLADRTEGVTYSETFGNTESALATDVDFDLNATTHAPETSSPVGGSNFSAPAMPDDTESTTQSAEGFEGSTTILSDEAKLDFFPNATLTSSVFDLVNSTLTPIFTPSPTALTTAFNLKNDSALPTYEESHEITVTQEATTSSTGTRGENDTLSVTFQPTSHSESTETPNITTVSDTEENAETTSTIKETFPITYQPTVKSEHTQTSIVEHSTETTRIGIQTETLRPTVNPEPEISTTFSNMEENTKTSEPTTMKADTTIPPVTDQPFVVSETKDTTEYSGVISLNHTEDTTKSTSNVETETSPLTPQPPTAKNDLTSESPQTTPLTNTELNGENTSLPVEKLTSPSTYQPMPQQSDTTTHSTILSYTEDNTTVPIINIPANNFTELSAETTEMETVFTQEFTTPISSMSDDNMTLADELETTTEPSTTPSVADTEPTDTESPLMGTTDNISYKKFETEASTLTLETTLPSESIDNGNQTELALANDAIDTEGYEITTVSLMDKVETEAGTTTENLTDIVTEHVSPQTTNLTTQMEGETTKLDISLPKTHVFENNTNWTTTPLSIDAVLTSNEWTTPSLVEENVTTSEKTEGNATEAYPVDAVLDEQALNATLTESANETTTESSGLECKEDQFLCKELNACLNNSFMCDGILDCPDGTDEFDCQDWCHSNFMCVNSSTCIMSEARCDGIIDCDNGSDEQLCAPTECAKHEVMCSDGSKCLKPVDICDWKYDCRDRSDEVGCVERTTCESSGKFFCNDGLCIPWSLKCDGEVDCKEGEDEGNCTCVTDEYECNDGKCLKSSSRCDGHTDCRDGDDEMGCVNIDANHMVVTYEPYMGTWAMLCAADFTLNDAYHLCQELGYGTYKRVEGVLVSSNGTWMAMRRGNQTQASLWTERVGFIESCASSRAAQVECQTFACGEYSGLLHRRRRKREVTSSTQWPFIAYTSTFHSSRGCLSQILTPIWIISSADCLLSLQKEPFNVSDWFVRTNIGQNMQTDQNHEVLRILLHPHSSKFRSLIIRDYDVALVRLTHPLHFVSDKIGAICPPEEQVPPGITCFSGVLGTEKPRAPPPSPLSINSLALQIVERESCNTLDHYNDSINPRMLCTQSSEGHTICDNDEGTPLMCLTGINKWFLAGMLTYQRYCEVYSKHPAVFSNLFAIRKFLDQVIGQKQYEIPYDSSLYAIIPPTTPTPTVMDSTTPMFETTLLNLTDGYTNESTALNGTEEAITLDSSSFENVTLVENMTLSEVEEPSSNSAYRSEGTPLHAENVTDIDTQIPTISTTLKELIPAMETTTPTYRDNNTETTTTNQPTSIMSSTPGTATTEIATSITTANITELPPTKVTEISVNDSLVTELDFTNQTSTSTSISYTEKLTSTANIPLTTTSDLNAPNRTEETQTIPATITSNTDTIVFDVGTHPNEDLSFEVFSSKEDAENIETNPKFSDHLSELTETSTTISETETTVDWTKIAVSDTQATVSNAPEAFVTPKTTPAEIEKTVVRMKTTVIGTETTNPETEAITVIGTGSTNVETETTTVSGIEATTAKTETMVAEKEKAVIGLEKPIDGTETTTEGTLTTIDEAETVVDEAETVVDGTETTINGTVTIGNGTETTLDETVTTIFEMEITTPQTETTDLAIETTVPEIETTDSEIGTTTFGTKTAASEIEITNAGTETTFAKAEITVSEAEPNITSAAITISRADTPIVREQNAFVRAEKSAAGKEVTLPDLKTTTEVTESSDAAITEIEAFMNEKISSVAVENTTAAIATEEATTTKVIFPETVATAIKAETVVNTTDLFQAAEKKCGQWMVPSNESWPALGFLQTISSSSSERCAASALSARSILTSLRCILLLRDPPLNSSAWTYVSSSSELHAVEEIVAHAPLALVRLKEQTNLSDTLCLPQHSRGTDECLAVGWTTAGGDKLHSVPVHLSECPAHYNQSNQSVCATQPNTTLQQTCQLDAGSPLLCFEDGAWSLRGILDLCEAGAAAALFDDISAHTNWILQRML